MSGKAKTSCISWKRDARTGAKRVGLAAIVTVLGLCQPAHALWFGTYGTWDTQTRKDAADAALTAVCNRYNAYGDFNTGSDAWIDVYYDSGVPTANCSWYGAMTFGGTWPAERVALHESNHWLGSNYGHAVNGQRAITTLEQFDGIGARFSTDGTHFWGYGLNYDSEWSEVNAQRNIAIMYAFRGDWGLGPTSNPTIWGATNVTLTASDALGESGFNYGSKWSDSTFAHPNAAYATGDFTMRTPASSAGFAFRGASLTVNNTNGLLGGLLYKGSGTTGITTIKNLTLNGGYVRHASGSGDLFQLAGNVTLSGTSTIDASQGNIRVLAPISGSGSLTVKGAYTTTLTSISTYAGSTNITGGTLQLGNTSSAAIANYTFDSVSGSTVNNMGTGGASMNGTLANGATIVAGGQSGNAVSFTSGSSVNISSPVTDLGSSGNWTVSAWVKTATPGATILSKSDGGWNYGNSVFYLGDGSAGGSGGTPSAVRWAGGFFQTASGGTRVINNAWHMVTYVNNGGSYAIYTDGVLQSLSSGNSGFSAADVGSLINLGLSVNTVAGDGAVNFVGLMDNVQIYGQPLNSTQITALYQGLNIGPLPTTTDVTISSGAKLDVNGVVQQIRSLSGVSGSAVTLGSGQLIVNSTGSSTFAGIISGSNGSMVKSGSGTLTLSGTNSYTGSTTVTAGTLILGPSAHAPILSGGGAILNGGRLVMNYSGSGPKSVIVADLTANASTGFLAGKVRTSLAVDTTKAIGWLDDGTSTFQARYTYKGDIDLSGAVDSLDFNAFIAGYGKTASVIWADGDANYDGKVNALDFNYLAGNFGLAPLAGAMPGDVPSLGAVVPEPASMAVLAFSTFALSGRRCRRSSQDFRK